MTTFEVSTPTITYPVKPLVKSQAAGIAIDPRGIPDLEAWFDGSDPDTITIETGVSEWKDKSGNGWHLTQAATAWQPSRNDNRRITFPDVAPGVWLSNNSFTALNGLNSYTILILGYSFKEGVNQSALAIHQTSVNAHGVLIELNTQIDPDVTRFLHRVPLGGGSGDSDDLASGSGLVSQTQPQIYIARRDGGVAFSHLFAGAWRYFGKPRYP